MSEIEGSDITIEDVILMLQARTVQLYLLILAIAIWKCIRLYHQILHQLRTKKETSLIYYYSYKGVPPICCVSIIGITWFYIFRFILTNQTTSVFYFDDAYKDVLREHYFTSTQLLTWAIVSVVWVSSESNNRRKIEERDGNATLGGIPFLLFGFLGAMGASFSLWIPSRSMSKQIKGGSSSNISYQRSIPLVYAITSIMAMICILKIRPCHHYEEEVTTLSSNSGNESINDYTCETDNGFGSFTSSFRFYLHALHYVLLLPIALTWMFPATKKLQIDSTLLYGALGVSFSIWNIIQLMGAKDSHDNLIRIPETDCQKSIHIDLFWCSLLTLYTIYHDTTNHGDLAIIKTFLGTLLMPIISPAAVLSLHLCHEQLPISYQALVGTLQRRIAHYRRNADARRITETNEESKNASVKKSSENTRYKTAGSKDGWCNLGLWNKDQISYDEACENLALALAEEVELREGDGVLSCGCGVSGKELELYYSRFKLGHITGIDPCVETGLLDEPNIRRMQTSVDELISGCDAPKCVFRRHLFNKILALDNIYHYPEKLNFFQYCIDTLPNGGKVGVTDIIWKNNDDKTAERPWWAPIALSLMGVTPSNLWSESQYREHLERLGFDAIKVKRIGSNVFSGWEGILPTSIIEQCSLDYCIIVARKKVEEMTPNSKGDCKVSSKKRVAIIGSGMSGLVTAHKIFANSCPQDVEVKVFEAASKPGLAGNSFKMEDQFVDVPARMAALGYYKEYISLAKDLGVGYHVVKKDSVFHGDDGEGNYIKHIYEESGLINFVNAILLGGTNHFLKMVYAFSSIPSLLTNLNKGLSFGDWLHHHLNIYPSSNKSDDPSKHQGWNFSYFAKHENSFLYLTIGSLSWMLSCTYRQLIAYPADIVLPYIDGLGLTRFLGVFNESSVVRIQPSIKALENALLYGIDFESGVKVFNLKENKSINGVEYDVVICATEASAVPYVIQNCHTVFGKFQYHPSTIYLHNDSSLLPKNRSDWRTWGVQMQPQREEPQLTFWLNSYYDQVQFNGDVFQTWAPFKDPKKECVIEKFNMNRVVHTSSSRDMVDLIAKEQGKRGFYYAGSYIVYGMGLLEEATVSGVQVSKQVLHDLFFEKTDEGIVTS